MPGMGRMNPRMMKKLQKQLQSATEEIDATEVIIRTKDKEYYFSNPSVSAMNMMGQQSYQIVGEPEERALGSSEETTNIPQEDIDLVASQAGVSPDKAKTAVPIACTSSHSAQNIAFNELGRQAITADHNWMDGKYNSKSTLPDKGLAVARMAAHITYLSKKGLQEKFGRKLQERDDLKFGFDADFQIESYLRYQGSVFVDRFDANSYLYITRAMDYFDLVKQFDGNLSNAFKKTKTKFFIMSFTSDWLYPTQENKDIVIALNAIGANVGFVEIESDKGHDSFLLEVPDFLNALKNFLDKSYIESNNES